MVTTKTTRAATAPTKAKLEQEKLAAETRKLLAEAKYAEEQARAQSFDAEMAQALANSAQIALAKETRRATWEKASDVNNRIYQFAEPVGSESVEGAVEVLSRWNRIDNESGDIKRPYYFVIASGGGAVVPGMRLYTAIKALTEYRPVITVASGVCASMATIIHQAGTERLIEPGCSYLVHDVSGETWGNIDSMKDTMAWFDKLNHQLHQILAERSNLTVEEVAEKAKRKDYWILPDEVVAHGLADRIGSIWS